MGAAALAAFASGRAARLGILAPSTKGGTLAMAAMAGRAATVCLPRRRKPCDFIAAACSRMPLDDPAGAWARLKVIEPEMEQQCEKIGLHVWRCLTGWRPAASRVSGSLHTTETFFLWQAGPYITRQRVPLTVVYDRHPTTPCPSEESWPKHPSSTAIVRLLWTGLGPRTFLPSPDSLSLSRSLFLSFIGLPPY